jgi:hypothetical protein
MTTKVKAINPFRIKINQAITNSGLSLEDIMTDSVVPACCSEGCEVEPDGKCEHDCPSVLLAMGVI